MDFTMTSEELGKIQAWMDGKSPVPKEELEAYFRLGEAIRRKLITDSLSAGNKAARLEERLERYRQKDEQSALEGEYDSLGIPTVDLAKAVLWSARKQGIHLENKRRFRILVFAVYCSWLGSQRQRVTIEHPIAQEAYGPVLPKMLNERDVAFNMEPTSSEYNSIASVSPGLAKTIDNCVRKYCGCSVEEAEKHFKGKDTPFEKTARECRKAGKSALEMNDKDIYLWKREHY